MVHCAACSPEKKNIGNTPSIIAPQSLVLRQQIPRPPRPIQEDEPTLPPSLLTSLRLVSSRLVLLHHLASNLQVAQLLLLLLLLLLLIPSQGWSVRSYLLCNTDATLLSTSSFPLPQVSLCDIPLYYFTVLFSFHVITTRPYHRPILPRLYPADESPAWGTLQLRQHGAHFRQHLQLPLPFW